MIVFKIFKRTSVGLISYSGFCGYCLRYLPEAWTSHPHGWGLIAAFDTLRNAINFLGRSLMDYEIWECETEKSIPALRCNFFFIEEGKRKVSQYSIPEGTVCCEMLRPIKMVYEK